jgi:magnesium chelatase subunit D
VNNTISKLSNSLIRGLIAAALNPGLRNVLVFDATIDTLTTAAKTLELMLGQVTNCQITTMQLGVVETEEDLWGQLLLRDKKIVWQPGVLTRGQGQELQVVIIPDLTRLSMAGARACVTLMGADVAYLERHGKRGEWQPNLCWLAGCPSKKGETGLVSPHLLDRFALRLSEPVLEVVDRVGEVRPAKVRDIRDFLEDTWQSEKSEDVVLPLELVDRLRQAGQVSAAFTLEAGRRVVDYFADSESYSVRRELALLRLAQVQAQLDGVVQIRQSQVDEAAAMIGLKLWDPINVQKPSPVIEEMVEDEVLPELNLSVDRGEQTAEIKEPDSPPIEKKVDRSEINNEQPEREVSLPMQNPYREDDALVQREAASLRFPLRRLRLAGRGGGAVVGVEPTTDVQDLAIVSTIFEAAKYQKFRGANRLGSDSSLIFQPGDLRRYRRALVPEQMLAMVIDYTCLQNSPWQAALLPYLQWAYVERAKVCLVQVGAAKAQDELRAEKVVANNILGPQIGRGLESVSGRKATPLAHGLDLTLEVLRHNLQHGRNRLEQIALVVVTDGRGNVPLQASKGGDLIFPVGRLGVDDALHVARQISRLKMLKAVVLNPQPNHYSELPVILAEALGAKIADITLPEAWEVEGEV